MATQSNTKTALNAITSKTFTRERLILALRFLPLLVGVYSIYHTFVNAFTRSSGFVSGLMIVGGMIAVEIVLFVSYELISHNHVSGLQRYLTIAGFAWATALVSANVLVEVHGISQEYLTFLVQVLLPTAPIQSIVWLLFFVLADDQARLTSKQIANDTRLRYLQSLTTIEKGKFEVQAQRQTLKQFGKAFKSLLSETDSAMMDEKAMAKLEAFAEKKRDHILKELEDFSLGSMGVSPSGKLTNVPKPQTNGVHTN